MAVFGPGPNRGRIAAYSHTVAIPNAVVLTTTATTLEQLARQIEYQYEISYTLPAGVKPSDRLQVTSKRKGVTLRAPTYLPN